MTSSVPVRLLWLMFSKLWIERRSTEKQKNMISIYLSIAMDLRTDDYKYVRVFMIDQQSHILICLFEYFFLMFLFFFICICCISIFFVYIIRQHIFLPSYLIIFFIMTDKYCYMLFFFFLYLTPSSYTVQLSVSYFSTYKVVLEIFCSITNFSFISSFIFFVFFYFFLFSNSFLG